MDAFFKSPKSATTAALLALCFALALLFWPVFFQGKVLVPGDIPGTDPFLSAPNRSAVTRPQNTLLADQIEQFYVWHTVAATGMRDEGQVPLWNPYIFTGQPLLANSQSSLFYPPNLFLHLMSPGKVATLRICFNLLVAGLFTFLFGRELKISPAGSLVAALSFALSGPLLVWVGFPLANVVACLPFLMWAGERLLRRGGYPAACLLGGGMGLSLLAGHPETSFQVLAVFSLYFLVRVVFLDEERRLKIRLLLGFLLAVLVGALVSGVQIVPFLDFMQQSSTFARGGRGGHGGGSFFYSPEWVANLVTGFTLFCPNFFGNPLDQNYIWPFASFQNYNEQAVYFGIVPLALATGALFADAKRRPVYILASLALFCLTVAWHLPGFEAVSHLPIFSMAPNKRLRLPFVFLGAVLAGYGYDTLREHLDSPRFVGQRRFLWGAGAILLLTLALFVWIVTAKFTVGPSVPPDSFRHLLFYNVFSASQWRTFLPLAVALAAAGGYLASRTSAGMRRFFPTLVLLLVFVELVGLGWGYNPAVSEDEILPAAPAVDFMKAREREPFRILTTDGFFYPNFAAVYGIGDVAGYDVPVYQRFSDLYLAQGGKSVGEQIDSRQQWDPDWPLVDFLNVKYVVSPRELKAAKYQKVYRVANLNIYRNSQALPRAFLVHEAQVVPDRKGALDLMVKGGFDFRSRVIIEEPAAGLSAPTPGGSVGSSVEVQKYGTDRVALTVRDDRPAILVLSDLFTPDWKVAVDGKQAKLLRADYAYRAVQVPVGTHEVVFSYQPASYRIGGALSLAGLFVLAGACLISIRQRVQLQKREAQ